MSNTTTAVAIRDDMSLGQLGDMLARSGYFTDARDAAQCVVKVLAGRELGFGPVASMTGVYIVKGRVSLSANLMAAAVRRSGRYTFKVNILTPENCEIEFFEIIAGKRESLGVSAFSLKDAQKAGTQNLDKFPRNMLYARAMSNGVKWFCPDVTGGPVYTPEELGENVNEDGEIVPAAPVKAVSQAPRPTVEPPSVIEGTAVTPSAQPVPLSAEQTAAVNRAADWLAVNPRVNDTEQNRARLRQAADWLAVNPRVNADNVGELRHHVAATGWVKPEGVAKDANDVRALFADWVAGRLAGGAQ